MRKLLFPLMSLALTFSHVLAQQEAQQAQSRLNKIRTEIRNLQEELNQSERNLQTHMQDLEHIEKQISLQHKAVRILQNEIHSNKKRVVSIEDEIDTVRVQIKRLREVYHRQVVFAYKHQRGEDLEWILGAENFNQALMRYKYFQRVADGMNHVYERMARHQARLVTLQDEHVTKLEEQQQLALEKQTEQRRLTSNQEDRKQHIDKISENTVLLQQAIGQRQSSARRLENLIATLTRERSNPSESQMVQINWDEVGGDFSAQRKRLNWPIRGKILHNFGKYKNPELKTVLLNNGIDIRAEKGETVSCVFPGVVSVVTYMGGYGNTVIIDHNNEYYTVYAHLDEVYVSKFQILKAGDSVGTVGTSGSLEGPMLHFEIYANNQPSDPNKWLK